MLNNRVRKHAFVATAIAGIAIMGSLPAIATGENSTAPRDVLESPVAKSNPHVSTEVLKQLPEVLLDDADLYIAPTYEAGTPIVYPDGSPVPGQSDKQIAAAANCGGTAWGPPGGYWGAVSSGCAVWGSPGFEETYVWNVANGSYSTGCVQVQGHYRGLGPTYPIITAWYSAGCGDTAGGATVPWGNVLDEGRARASSNGGAAGFTVSWGH